MNGLLCNRIITRYIGHHFLAPSTPPPPTRAVGVTLVVVITPYNCCDPLNCNQVRYRKSRDPSRRAMVWGGRSTNCLGAMLRGEVGELKCFGGFRTLRVWLKMFITLFRYIWFHDLHKVVVPEIIWVSSLWKCMVKKSNYQSIHIHGLNKFISLFYANL